MKKHIKKILIISGLIILVVVGFIINKKDDINVEIPKIINDGKEKAKIIVEIKGEVNVPGIYILEEDARVYDLIYLAGGVTVHAKTDTLNLATKLSDGSLIIIAREQNTNVKNKISINTASLNELMSLPGIGEAKARSIISYRNENGSFIILEDLMNVTGISENIFEQIKESICL